MNYICDKENQEYILDISKIRPNNVKKSDKYSKNIYEYVFHHLRMNEVFYIMDDADTSLTPFDLQESLKYFQPKISKQILKNVWIGTIDPEEDVNGMRWMSGNHLFNIVSDRKGNFTVWANPWCSDKTVINITKLFWEKYIDIGRCIYGDHSSIMSDDTNRFTYFTPTYRKCNWCGREEHYIEKTFVYTKKVWEEM